MTADEIAGEKTDCFLGHVRRVFPAVEDAAVFLWTLGKLGNPLDAPLTVTEMDLINRFYRAFGGTEAGAL